MKKVLTMSFDSTYYQSGRTLIASLHKTSYDTVDEIIIYNLGLTKDEIDFLNKCEKVKVVEYPEIVKTLFNGYLEPKQYAWKLLVHKNAGQYGDLIFYLDAGAMALKNISIIYDLIAKDDIFLVDQSFHKNYAWTNPLAFELMQATEEEIKGGQMCGGIVGYKVNGRYQKMIDEAFLYSQNKDIVHGDRTNHRHDQSILSVLSIRYKCPRQPFEIYAEDHGILRDDQVIYVHRGHYLNEEGLRLI